MDPANWGWNVQGDKFTLIMMDNNPAPNILLNRIHCNCSAQCNTLRCSCKKYGLECTGACGSCQDGNCDNMNQASILDENEDCF
ncbi:hypothetical protein SNE40_014397 [Patella caerulea]|uniref:Tesmin/TSO1-like CXC domain-containing protein n=1 Tax=Patella caerulea TaxID=87958 RepID=A0AAN8JL19_PATCE